MLVFWPFHVCVLTFASLLNQSCLRKLIQLKPCLWCYLIFCSFWVEFSTFSVTIIQSLLEMGVGPLWGHHKFSGKELGRLFLWTLWIFEKRILSFSHFFLHLLVMRSLCEGGYHVLAHKIVCRMDRQPEHVMTFLLAEMGTRQLVDLLMGSSGWLSRVDSLLRILKASSKDTSRPCTAQVFCFCLYL